MPIVKVRQKPYNKNTQMPQRTVFVLFLEASMNDLIPQSLPGFNPNLFLDPPSADFSGVCRSYDREDSKG